MPDLHVRIAQSINKQGQIQILFDIQKVQKHKCILRYVIILEANIYDILSKRNVIK
jgi:hypothetical protein